MLLPKTPYISSPSSMVLEEVIRSKYELIDKIGEGTYGTVYKAINLNTDKPVAIKKINHQQDYGLRCLIEPLVMSSIKHKNIVHANEIITHSSFTCMVMDLAKDDLYNYIKLHPSTLDLLQRIQWVWELCQALACLHQNDIIHGDIKAANCLIMEDKSMKLCDFTLSIFSPKNKLNTHTVCTFTHRPPEILMDYSWDKSVDIWALGCTIYEIIYGKTLFQYQGDPSKQTEDSTLNSKMILCLKDWGKLNNQSIDYLSIPIKKNIKYISPNLRFKDEPEYYAINDLILSMLQLDPANRPSIFHILSHPVFRYTFQLFPYKTVEFLTSTTNELLNYDSFIQSCLIPKDIIDLVYKLIYYIIQEKCVYISESKNSLFIWTCIFIIAKITHQPMHQSPPYPWSEIVSMENYLITQLHYEIPFCSLQYNTYDYN